MRCSALFAAFAPGNGTLQNARGAAATVAAVVVISLLVEREVLVARRASDAPTAVRRITAIAAPLVALLVAVVAARLRSYA